MDTFPWIRIPNFKKNVDVAGSGINHSGFTTLQYHYTVYIPSILGPGRWGFVHHCGGNLTKGGETNKDTVPRAGVQTNVPDWLPENIDHRRSIYTEEGKGRRCCLGDLPCYLFCTSKTWCKIASTTRNWVNSVLQAAETTFDFSSMILTFVQIWSHSAMRCAYCWVYCMLQPELLMVQYCGLAGL